MTDADAAPDEADPEMVQINLRLSEAFLEDIDATWKEQGFNSRSEFLRFLARDAVRRPAFSREVTSLSDRMRTFVEETGGDDLKRLRRTASSGKPLSEVVIEDRNDRV